MFIYYHYECHISDMFHLVNVPPLFLLVLMMNLIIQCSQAENECLFFSLIKKLDGPNHSNHCSDTSDHIIHVKHSHSKQCEAGASPKQTFLDFNDALVSFTDFDASDDWQILDETVEAFMGSFVWKSNSKIGRHWQFLHHLQQIGHDRKKSNKCIKTETLTPAKPAV